MMMMSYEERLESFSDWPEAFKPKFIRKLALIGQYSLDAVSLSTACVFCAKRLEDWKTQDEPLLEHLSHSAECVLFTLANNKSRKALLASHSKSGRKGSIREQKGMKVTLHRTDNIDENDLAKRHFGMLEIKKGVPFYFCLKCGSLNLSHYCERRMFKITRKNLHSDLFYIRLFSGDFIDDIDTYLNSELFLPEQAKDILRYVLDNVGYIGAFESIDSVISRGVEKLVRDFDLEAKKIEQTNIGE